MVLLISLFWLIVLAVAVLLGSFIAWILLRSGASQAGGGSSSGGGPAIYKLEFTDPAPNPTEPDIEFEKDAETTFTALLTKYHAGSMSYRAFPDEDSLVGIVEPDSVKIVKINGQDPGTAESYPGIQAKAHKTKSGSDGKIKIVLKGSEPADGQLSVFYVVSATDVKTAQADFSVIE